MPDLLTTVARFRAALLDREAVAVAAVADAYEDVISAIDARAQAILQTAGDGPLTTAQLFERSRLARIRTDVVGELEAIAPDLAATIEAGQEGAVRLAQEAVPAIAEASSTSALSIDARLPRGATQAIIGAVSDGSPLAAHLTAIAGETGQAVRTSLIRSVALGENPRVAARRIRQVAAFSRARAETVARTEILRAHRDATLETYRQNRGLIVGWRWLSARGARTCGVCFAMDGEEFPLSVPFASHPNCRCTQLSVIRPSLRSPDRIGTGPQAFARLSDAEQIQIVGIQKHAALASGRIDLQDLVGEGRDPRWGPYRYERSLRDILGGRGAAQAAGG